MSKILATPFNKILTLQRYPYHKRDLLQAWDSADELILQHVSQLELKGKRILILNDTFGALSCALEGFDITSYTDSYISSQGIGINSQNRIRPIHQLKELSGIYDYVLIRIPKNMSFFEDILSHLSHHLHSESNVIFGFMIKHLAQTSFKLIEHHIGMTSTSLAQKKARLIFARFQRTPAQLPSPFKVFIEPFELPFVNYSNLFSREKLDIGTRFLLDHIPQGNYKSILDLGCANGVIGIAAKKLNPSAKIIFSDESYMAIQSAMINYQNNFSDSALFLWIHSFEHQMPNSVDFVICNPPFHQNNNLTDLIAWQMFVDAHKALTRGGTLRVIGNFHLQYQVTLKKIFGKSQIVAQNSKFLIIDAFKS